MIKMLRDSGLTVNKVYPGIYRFEGNLSIPVQLVISSQITSDEYDGLKLLAKGATEEDVISYAMKAIDSGNQTIKNNAGTVINVCLSANKNNKNLKGVKKMYEGFKEFFKDFIEEERQEVRQEGRQEGIQEGRQEGTEKEKERVVTNMLKRKFSLPLIAEISQLSEDAIRGIAGNLGLAVV